MTQFLEKYTSHFIWKVVCERELETEQRLQHIVLTSSLDIAMCHSRSPGLLLNWRAGGPFCWVLASFTASCHQRVSKLNRGSRELLLQVGGFPYHIFSPTGLQTHWLPVFTELYNSSITHSISPHNLSLPLSSEWHVWLSSSRNNCHAVHRSLSSGASVYNYTVGFYLVPYCQPDLPTPMDYALPPSLEWHVWRGRRSIYNIFTTFSWWGHLF